MDGQEMKSLTLNYDAENDVLYCSFERGKDAVSFEVADGVLVRRDPHDEHLVGFTILDLRRKSLEARGFSFEVPLDKAAVKDAA